MELMKNEPTVDEASSFAAAIKSESLLIPEWDEDDMGASDDELLSKVQQLKDHFLAKQKARSDAAKFAVVDWEHTDDSVPPTTVASVADQPILERKQENKNNINADHHQHNSFEASSTTLKSPHQQKSTKRRDSHTDKLINAEVSFGDANFS